MAGRPVTGATWRADGRFAPLFTAMLALLILVMVVPDDLDYAMHTAGGAVAAGGIAGRVLWIAIACFGILAIASRARLATLLAREFNPFMLLFVALAIASIAWSIDPSLSLKRLVRRITFLGASFGFVLWAWQRDRFQAAVRPILTALLCASLVFGMVAPSLAIHQESASELVGAWHGLATHKNGFGALASLTLVLWVHGWLATETGAARATFGAGVALACLYLARSFTSDIAAATGVGYLLVVYGLAPRQRAVVTVVGVLLLALYTLAALDVIPGIEALTGPLAALSDKSISFTGRTEIWSIIDDHIAVRPLLGSGYSAYWTTDPTPGTESYAFISRMDGFYPVSAHNGYLDTLNDLGWVGLACLVTYLGAFLGQSLELGRHDPAQAALYLAIFFQQAITNTSESHWFSVRSVDLVIMTLATAALARGMLELRLRHTLGGPGLAATHVCGTGAR